MRSALHRTHILSPSLRSGLSKVGAEMRSSAPALSSPCCRPQAPICLLLALPEAPDAPCSPGQLNRACRDLQAAPSPACSRPPQGEPDWGLP